jgi:hypothetical protein
LGKKAIEYFTDKTKKDSDKQENPNTEDTENPEEKPNAATEDNQESPLFISKEVAIADMNKYHLT